MEMRVTSQSAKESNEKYREQKERLTNKTPIELMKQPLMLTELQYALHQLKLKESPGPDGIYNEMLIHLCSAAVKNSLRFSIKVGKEGDCRKSGERQL